MYEKEIFMQRKITYLAPILALVVSLLACSLPSAATTPEATPAPTDAGFQPPTEAAGSAPTPAETEPSAQESPVAPPAAGGEGIDKEITLASTESLAKSGLLGKLVDAFQNATGYRVKLELGGAGRAFRLGEKYVADVLLVNEPGSEIKFISDGYGKDRILVFHTDYVIVGPADDPAGIKGLPSAVEALKKIAGAQAKFITRNTESEVLRREKRLWADAGVNPSGDWYIPAVDAGMVGVLKLASDKKAYTLTDRATFLDNKGNLQLVILVEGDPALFDPYHVVTGNPDRSPKINAVVSQAFVDFLLSPQAQEIIAQFGVDTYGEPIFFADGGKTEN